MNWQTWKPFRFQSYYISFINDHSKSDNIKDSILTGSSMSK